MRDSERTVDQDRSDDVEETVRLLRLFTEVADTTTAVVGDVLTEFDLTVSSSGLLWALDPHGPPLTMRDLATRLNCDPSTVSLAADKLQAAGLIERRPHPTDGRKRTLALTEQGHDVWTALSRRLFETSTLAALDPTERRTLNALLMKAKLR
ncbi:MarR family winged helix-turn-helix transcriptional regulator [Streptomyces sp. NPDC101151]|uniref:MarR family winged helix-turn-helix transcriptional regulator n=1 Tax=Streptomyces sp. NPDC101151 TaxID=3366115 RepID=UPI0038245DF7